MLKDFIGKELESDFNLNMNGNDQVQLITRGTKYLIMDVIGSDFLVKNDAGRFDLIRCSYFQVGE
jgi:hypothetical protein